MADTRASAHSAMPHSHGGGNVVRVSLPASVAYDLEKLQRIQKDILGKLGCLGCCSGWDIRWDVFRGYVVDEKLNVHPAAGGLVEVG